MEGEEWLPNLSIAGPGLFPIQTKPRSTSVVRIPSIIRLLLPLPLFGTPQMRFLDA